MDLAGKKMLQEYHSSLFRLFGIITDFVSEDGRVLNLCLKEHFNPICDMIRNSECGSRLCCPDWKRLQLYKKLKESIIYKCHAGFVEIVVPLFVNKKFIGCLTAGQILNEKPTEESYQEFRNKTEYLKVDEKNIRKHYFATKVFSDEQVKALLELLELAGNYIVESENKILFLESAAEKDRISLARKFIERNYQNKITVADIARAVYQSESYFSHQFKNETGISVIQYLNRYRIEKAKELLRDSSFSITDIASKTGFQNLTHFNRIFKSLEQKCPSNYQKSRIGKKQS
jgi:AraC-like DNA-binding protein